MKARHLMIVILFIIFLLFALFFRFYNPNIVKEVNNSLSKVCFKKICFSVEIADTQELREKGLMFVDSLEEDKGMLFIFPEDGIYSFWMKNTLIPLDIIWINSEKKVVYVSSNSMPCVTDVCDTITPTENAKYVLELNSGIVEKIGLGVGDKVVIRCLYSII